MDFDKLITLVDSFGLPIVLLFGIVSYFYNREKKREIVIAEKDELIVRLSHEKVEILQAALEQFKASDDVSIKTLNQINMTLTELKNRLK